MKKEHKKILQDLHLQSSKVKYPSMPDEYRPKKNYNDKTANGLTTCIKDFLNFSGWQAERISVTGRRINVGKTKKTNAFGTVKTVGNTMYIPSTMTKGSSDISATIKGKSVKIEVKIGADKQSEKQIEYQKNIEKAGGVYFIAKNFEDFYEFYLEMVK
jgi:hypothetical protein